MVSPYNSTYEEQYCAWGRNSSEHMETVKILKKSMPDIKCAVVDKTLQMLSIGTADGHFDLLLLKELVKHIDASTNIVYTCVDPNEIFNAKFKSSIDENPEYLKNVSFVFCSQKFEEFLSSWDKEKKTHYGVVIFSHAMSIMSDKGSTLTKVVKELLGPKGSCILLEVTENEQSQKFINEMQKSVYCAHGELGQEEMSFEDFMGETIQQLPQRLGMKHEKQIFEAAVDMTSCYDEQSLDGNLILDFMVMKENVRDNVSSEVVKKILDLLATFCKETDGRQLLKSEVVAVNIKKQ